ncbi:tetratricopeptide repeat protein [Parvularcula lutaonensis]|uniref:Localization factor PodJL n=1 Tax=Parvularcula lutaonensis TaxID=491923 RepID=A0ABV7MBM4_9PROT|nr:tetratricopeptide repeat protein [Parvularcula lutaonensis]GGY36331.1 hypothetical protein GCM10007148_00620 [Parvularcula lutaonensis]
MSAKSNVPWSVKGIDPDARSVAKELARKRGQTLGEFITEMIREKGIDATGTESDAGHAGSEKVVSGVTTDQLRAVVDTLNRLNERLKAAEKSLRTSEVTSREAMGGLNKGLETVFERVKRLEKEAKGLSDAEGIAERLDRLEGAAEKNSWVKSLVALEKALSTLVEQVESSREDTEKRLARNEGLIEELQSRLSAEDEALRGEINQLLEAIDRTTDRLTETDAQVQAALDAAREAAESRDESFIERTSQRLQLLGSEIKRTSDQIRTLESSVSQLSKKIEAGEERSAEGISRVAQSLETLRREMEDHSLVSGEDAPVKRIKTAAEEADCRFGQLKGAFDAVVDRLEGRSTETTASVPFAAPPLPQEAYVDDFTKGNDTPDPEDEFDRVFDDPLNFTAKPRSPEAVTVVPEPAPDDGLRDPLDLGVPGYPNTSPGDEPAPVATAPATPAFTEGFSLRDEPAQAQPDPVEPAPTEPEVGREAYHRPTYDAPDEWHVPSSLDNPFTEESQRQTTAFADDNYFSEPETWTERLSAFLRRMVAEPVENNSALGWILIAVCMVAIGITAIRLSTPSDNTPVIVDPLPAEARALPATEPAPAEEDPDALFAEAKKLLATAATPEETSAAIALMTEAAEAGSVVAMHELGELYLAGDGVPQNGVLARDWFEEAARRGHIRAVHRVAYLDIQGIGGPVDTNRAILGFTRSANAGLAASMYNLGSIYDPRNPYLPEDRRDAAEALYWYRLAARQGDTRAAEQAAEIEGRLSPTELAAVRARLDAWRRQPL